MLNQSGLIAIALANVGAINARLRAAGYPGEFMTVEQGVSAYVKELQKQ